MRRWIRNGRRSCITIGLQGAVPRDVSWLSTGIASISRLGRVTTLILLIRVRLDITIVVSSVVGIVAIEALQLFR